MLAVAVAAQLGCSYIHQGLPALAPLLQAEWALSRAELGVLAGAMSVGVLLLSAAAGGLVDRLGERPLLIAGPLGVAAATFLASLSPSPLALTLSLAIAGAFLATGGPAGGKAMLVWFPTRIRGFAMGLRQTSVPLAGVVAGLTLPLLAASLGWRGALGAGALLAALAALLVALVYREPPTPAIAGRAEHTGPGALRALLRDRSLLATIALGPVLVTGQWTIVPYLGLYLYERFGWPVAIAAGYLALAQAGGVLGRIGWGLASDLVWRGRRKPVLALIPPAGALGILALAFLPAGASPVLVAVLALALGASVIGWNGLLLAFLAEQAGPARAGTAIGLGITVIFVSAVAIPPAFGWLVDRTGSYTVGWLVLSAVLLAALGLFPLIREAPRA
ncbi:MAG TPA: MFS transporter [Chloroflexota bacterium]|nr:MFS transporter [Chloroflexota bacterium]